MRHILVVDDDKRLRELLKRYLQKQGFKVSLATDAANASHLISYLDFDLMVVDVMMPGENGISFVKRIRQANHTPVLMLTAKAEVQDRLQGFEAGIDDFLSKPFEPKELVMRIEAILKRTRSEVDPNGVVVFGQFQYHFADQALYHNQERIDLTRTERDIMKLFAQNLGEVVSRDQFSKAIGEEGSARSVDVQITRLRKKLEEDVKNPRYIHTIRGAGYKLTPPLEI